MRLPLVLSLTAHSALLGGMAYMRAPIAVPALESRIEVTWAPPQTVRPAPSSRLSAKAPTAITTEAPPALPASTLDRVHALLDYPERLRRKHIQGQVQLLATLNPAGELLALTLESSSQTPELDAIAAQAVRSAAPFPELAPAHAVRIPIEFRITASR